MAKEPEQEDGVDEGDAILRRMLNTPPKPHKPRDSGGKKQDGGDRDQPEKC